MTSHEFILAALNEIQDALKLGYLSDNQVQILMSQANEGLAYNELIIKYKISCKTALSHCLERTCLLKFWDHSIPGEVVTYLNDYDKDIFIQIIRNAADDKNCVPSMYAVSLAYYIKKCRNTKSFQLLKAIGNKELASHCLDAKPIMLFQISELMFFKKSDIKQSSDKKIQTLRTEFSKADIF